MRLTRERKEQRRGNHNKRILFLPFFCGDSTEGKARERKKEKTGNEGKRKIDVGKEREKSVRARIREKDEKKERTNDG